MKKWKGIVELSALCMVIVASLFGSTYVLNHQFSIDELRVRGFYMEPKNSLDMVLIGSSAAYTTYNSAVAWKEEGFTSYELATSGAPMGLAKSMVKEVLKHQNPKLIMIDLNGVLNNDRVEQIEGMIRLWVDNIPMSENKIETINEVTDGKDPLSWYVPLYKYHQNWEKIRESLSYTGYDIKMRMGNRLPYSYTMRALVGVSGRAKLVDVLAYQKKRSLYGLSGKRFRDLMDYLKRNDIRNVAFFNMPRYYDRTMLLERRLLNQAIDLASQEGFRVYDFDREINQMNLDPKEDYYNSGHLNIEGQLKATKYIAKRINKDYLLSENDHAETIVAQWNSEYEEYRKIFDALKKNPGTGKKHEIYIEEIDGILDQQAGEQE